MKRESVKEREGKRRKEIIGAYLYAAQNNLCILGLCIERSSLRGLCRAIVGYSSYSNNIY
jgi:hypothetical protein